MRRHNLLGVALVLALAQPVVLAAHASAAPAQRSCDWGNVEIVGGGFVTGLLYHPTERDLLYARTDIGGAYRWNPSTKRWLPLTDFLGWDQWNDLGVESLALDPADPDRVYLAVGAYAQPWAPNGAVLRSGDRGKTWQRTDLTVKLGGNEPGRSQGERLVVHPRDGKVLYFGSRLDGLWRSVDAGATWARVESLPATNVPVVAIQGDVVYAAGDQTVYRSTDGGQTWVAVPDQPTGMIAHQAKFHGDTLYVTYADTAGPNGMTGGAVFKLNTATGAWTDITPLRPNTGTETGFGYTGLALDATGSVLVTTNNRWGPVDELFRSTDGGQTWRGVAQSSERDVSASPYLNWGGDSSKFGWWMGALAVDPYRPGRVLYGTGATIYGTDDIAAVPSKWTVRAQGLEETAIDDLISPPRGAHLLSGMRDLGGFRHDDLKRSPAKGMSADPIMTHTTDLDFAEHRPEIVVRVGWGAAGRSGAYSADGGTTWAPFTTQPTATSAGGTVSVSAEGRTIVWTPDGGTASWSTDKGATWKTAEGLPTGVGVVADRLMPSRFYAFDSATGTMYRGDGRKFASVATGLPIGEAQLDAVPGRVGDLWLASRPNGLYRSTDGGRTFREFDGIPAADTLGFGKAAPGRAYPAVYLVAEVDGQRGVFRSVDEGKNWVRINDEAHQWGWIGKTITGDPRVYGRVYLGSNGRGVLHSDTARC